MNEQYVQCANCGWTGTEPDDSEDDAPDSEDDAPRRCPVCADLVEFVD